MRLFLPTSALLHGLLALPLVLTHPARAQPTPGAAEPTPATAPAAEPAAPAPASGGGGKPSLNAGYKNGFFVSSSDDKFFLRVNPELQLRYVYNNRDDGDDPTVNQDTTGFQLRRIRIDLRGHAYDPALTYRIRFGSNRATGDAELEYGYVGYDFADTWNVRVGQFKPLFLHEENVSGFRQLAVERSYTADYFTIDYAQGVELTNDTTDTFHSSFTVYDGSYSANTDFNGDRTEVAAAGRGELLLAGDWKRFDDFTSWAEEGFALKLGFGGAYEIGEQGGGTSTPNLAKLTADVAAESNGRSFFAAVYAQSFDDNDDPALPTNLDDAGQLGFVVQGGAFVVPDKVELFARYEFIDFDGVYYRNSGGATQGGTGNLTDDELGIVTVGANYYIHKHNAKLSLDIQHALDPVAVANTGGGILSSTEDGQTALRAQLQFAF